MEVLTSVAITGLEANPPSCYSISVRLPMLFCCLISVWSWFRKPRGTPTS